MRAMLKLLFALLAVVPVVAAQLTPTGTLRAAFLATNPVQVRIDAQSGAMTGPVPDLVRELARRRGVPFTLMPVPDAAAVIDRVRSGPADIGFLAIEAARATQVDFSAPYLMMGNAYLVRGDSPIKQSSDIDRTGVKVAAVKGQSQQIFVSENLKAAQVTVLPTMPPNDAVVSMIVRGEIDAFAANRQRMEEAAHAAPGVRVLADNFLLIGQAIVVPKGDRQRLDDVNKFVAEIRASRFVADSIARAKLTGVEPAK